MKKNEINIAVNNDFLRSVSDVLSQARKPLSTSLWSMLTTKSAE